MFKTLAYSSKSACSLYSFCLSLFCVSIQEIPLKCLFCESLAAFCYVYHEAEKVRREEERQELK